MASKGQKFKKYTNDFRLNVVNKYLSGNYSMKYLSIKYDIPLNTIKTWLRKYKYHGYDLISKNHLKGRRNKENIDYKERYEILKKYQAFLKAQRERR